jgi:hypothetical protein
MLTKAQAQELVLTRLKARFESVSLSILEIGVSERSFGWVFLVSPGESAADGVSEVNLPRAVIVNKFSAQIVASSIDHEPERLIQLYERLLAKNQARADNWCLTVSVAWPWQRWRKRTIAERASEAGFYEIGGKEKAP